MKTIFVSKAFHFNTADQGLIPFAIGLHTVEDSVAKHPYVVAHCGEPSESAVASNHVAEELAAALKRNVMLEGALVTANVTITSLTDSLTACSARIAELEAHAKPSKK